MASGAKPPAPLAITDAKSVRGRQALLAASEAASNTLARGLAALAREAGFARCELSWRERPSTDVFELRR